MLTQGSLFAFDPLNPDDDKKKKKEPGLNLLKGVRVDKTPTPEVKRQEFRWDESIPVPPTQIVKDTEEDEIVVMTVEPPGFKPFTIKDGDETFEFFCDGAELQDFLKWVHTHNEWVYANKKKAKQEQAEQKQNVLFKKLDQGTLARKDEYDEH